MKKLNISLLIMVIALLQNFSNASIDKPETREEFEQKVKQLQEKTKELENTISEQKKEILDFKWSNYRLKYGVEPNVPENKKLQIITVIDNQATELTELRAKIKQLETTLETQKDTIRSGQKTITDLTTEIDNLREKNQRLSASNVKKQIKQHSDNETETEENGVTKETLQNLPVESLPPVSSVIESKVDGEFEGWEGETIVKLMNGQIWQQIAYYYHYHYAYMPEVLIYNSDGGWKMKVEGVDKAVWVQRLK